MAPQLGPSPWEEEPGDLRRCWPEPALCFQTASQSSRISNSLPQGPEPMTRACQSFFCRDFPGLPTSLCATVHTGPPPGVGQRWGKRRWLDSYRCQVWSARSYGDFFTGLIKGQSKVIFTCTCVHTHGLLCFIFSIFCILSLDLPSHDVDGGEIALAKQRVLFINVSCIVKGFFRGKVNLSIYFMHHCILCHDGLHLNPAHILQMRTPSGSTNLPWKRLGHTCPPVLCQVLSGARNCW